MSNLPAEEPSQEVMLAGLPADLFWEKYKSQILGGIAAGVILLLAAGAWFLYAHNVRVSSEAQFASAQTPEDYRAVVDAYPSTPVAANALLLLAAAQRAGGDLAASTATYEELLGSRPTYPLAPSASLGLAANAEVANQASRAVELLQQTTVSYQNSYAAPYALYASGEALLREGKRSDAVKMFRDLAGSYPESASANLALMQVEQLAPLAE